jgi:hypothetical protein
VAWTRSRTSAVLRLLVVLCLWPALVAAGSPAAECPGALARDIPARLRSLPAGSEFAARISGEDARAREQAIEQEILRGDLPSFLRRLKPVTLSARLPSGRTVTATVCVTPDYLAIGSDRDFLRIPMNLHTATAIASRFGFVLPTRKMVDAIYEQSEGRLSPQPMQAGPQMRSTAYYVTHNERIKAQRAALGIPVGALLAGHKKDVVLTNRLTRQPGKIAIYGWHRPGGKPIQPLSTVHGANYADYSHGIRLVSDVVFIDGEAKSIYRVLEDPTLSRILSDEGPLQNLPELIPSQPMQVARLERAAGASRAKF